MSVTNSSPAVTEKPCVNAHERLEDGRKDDANKECSFPSGGSPDRSAIQRVLKEEGLTSTTFIGPEFPPDTAKSNIDDTLDEFYKEIEMIERPKAAEDSPEKKVDFVQPHLPPVTSSSKNFKDRNEGEKGAKPFNHQQRDWERPSPWPHWYQNEPYFHQRPREIMGLMQSRTSTNQTHWNHPEMIKSPRPSNLRHSSPPLHHLPAFPYPQNLPSHEDYSRGGSTMTVQRPHFPTAQNIPPPHCPSSQVPFRDSLQGYTFLTHSGDNGNIGLSRDRKPQWCQWNEGYDRYHSRDLENHLWEHHCQKPDSTNGYHSKLVLILMRGLPGSGKSTLAR